MSFMSSVLSIIISEHKKGILLSPVIRVKTSIFTCTLTLTRIHDAHKPTQPYAEVPAKMYFAWCIKNAHMQVHTHTHKLALVDNQKCGRVGGNEVERRRSRLETEERWSKTKAWQKEIRERQSHDADVRRLFRSKEGGVEGSRLSKGK